MISTLLFYVFAAVLVLAALGVITSRNPVHAALFLVLAFVQSAALWLLLEAEFLAVVLILVYVGAVMVLFLFVVMMLDINVEEMREGFTRYVWIGAAVALGVIAEIWYVLAYRGEEQGFGAVPEPLPADYSSATELGAVLYTEHIYAFEIAAMILLDRRRDTADHAQAPGSKGSGRLGTGRGPQTRPSPAREGRGHQGLIAMVTVSHYLVLAGILFSLAVAGIFINRKNVILLLMCIELMLLAVNFNFIAFSRLWGDTLGQAFVFFILTVAASEAAIGLAILVVLFRNTRSINVEALAELKE